MSVKSAIASECDAERGSMRISVDLPASLERVFRALASEEVTQWWVRPGVFDTREWSGDVRKGGRWWASGIGGGHPYTLEGEFIDVDAPRKLKHTWHLTGTPAAPTNVSYELEPIDGGTRLSLTHERFTTPDGTTRTFDGWVTSVERLKQLLS